MLCRNNQKKNSNMNDLNSVSFLLNILALHELAQTNQEIKKGNHATINGTGEHTVDAGKDGLFFICLLL